jgi:UDP-glucose 4-epimerase
MRQNGIKTLSFSSSAAIYGEPEKIPVQEDDRTIPINPYGMTKLAMEGLLSSYVYSYGMTGIALRYFNLYGPEERHEPETHAIPRFIDQIYHDQPVTIWGQGEHLRDYIYIDDVVSAHLLALDLADREPAKYHYFNLSTEKPTSVLEVATTIAGLMNKEPNLQYNPPRPGDPLKLYADASKAHQHLGWHPQTDLQTGLRKTVEYFASTY